MGNDDFTFTKHWPLSRIPVPAPPPPSLDHAKIEIENDGIYRGLPVYDALYHGKTALVAGANGISGSHMLKAMSRHPEIWSHVYALSRRPPQMNLPPKFAKNVSHHVIDLLTTSEQVGKELREAKITECDYALFYAYIQTDPEDPTQLWAAAAQLAEINGKLFYNFLEGIKAAGLRPKRVLLQTGEKGYSSHLGPTFGPKWEDDAPRARNDPEPNFYYTQEDIMWKYCEENKIEWTYSRPGVILGLTKDNALVEFPSKYWTSLSLFRPNVMGFLQNLIIPLAMYAAITKYMGEKILKFPGNRAALEQIHDPGSAIHNGIMMEWQCLAPQAANQIFHTTDGSAFSWLRFWEWYSQYFGLHWEPPLADDDPDANYMSYHTSTETPPIGYGGPTTCKYSFTLAEWSTRPNVRKAWDEMVEKYGLDHSYIDMKYSWAMANWAICRWWDDNLSMAKARKFGYFGTVDWTDSIGAIFEDAAAMKIIPPIRALKQRNGTGQ